ncbi:putative UBX domain-containing protein 2/7 [Medicago truncatula]|uniref:Putative UBX domain-containing protein 2/7 n=1 Tax=Medicago truncatula TaxID=3880 RepID=B7FH13_MEDTR|nr:plant UBX domain-containing protein 7 [Medicago truncatula]ACJ84042.1 unknown [Medicago truncatula]AES86375.1 UBX domain protein [Medicago truncatula]RHN58304.1 putative UBX domain-containing protein 2/7 [Medicago truncatula]
MEGMTLSYPTDEETLVSYFLEIARGQTAATAKHFLQATSWNLEEALKLFLSGTKPPLMDTANQIDPSSPLPLIKETLESEQGASSTSESDKLAYLYHPPFHLMFNGSFIKAKFAASMQDKWLIVNIQSTKEFSSLMLNRDTWANDAVSQIISTNFIFWLVYDDTTEGHKVCTDYRLDLIPVVLIIDPITGQKIRSWGGMIQPESLIEGLLTFLDAGPRGSSSRPKTKATVDSESSEEEDEEVQRKLAASLESVKESSEMTGGDNKDANVAGNLQETTSLEFEKLRI